MDHKMEIYSIFGQCEQAAERKLALRIEADMIPASVALSKNGKRALFAIIVTGANIARFNKLCRDLRA